MIDRIELKNYGKHESLSWDNLGKINIIVGKNGTGKSFILKSIYTAMKTIEMSGRGDDFKTMPEILAEKLYWTFQVGNIGNIVKKSADSQLNFSMDIIDAVSTGAKGNFSYGFGKDTTKIIKNFENTCQQSLLNTVFIPAKEVLSLSRVISYSRDQMNMFGFDDTYYDLVKAIEVQPQRGKNFTEFSEGRHKIREVIGGSIEYDNNKNVWTYKDENNYRYTMMATSEGVKKIAILDQLLGNRYILPGSVLIFDEPEAGVHPNALSALMEILAELASRGVQIFIATHSYFVVKKAYIIAMQKEMNIPFLSLNKDGTTISGDLSEDMPENDIISESIKIYEEEVDEIL